MTVLIIMGLLLVVITIGVIIAMINGYSEKKFDYEFFNWANFAITSVGYCAIFFGNNWYEKALSSGGDILNGQILIAIGIIIVLWMFINNIRRTDFIFGTIIGVLQLIIYIPASVVCLLGVIMLLAWASETKPVVNLN